MHQTQFSEKIPYGGFSQIRSQCYNIMLNKRVKVAYRTSDEVMLSENNIKMLYCIPTLMNMETVYTSHFSIKPCCICDRIWENLAYLSNAHMAQCAFLVSPVKKHGSPVIFTCDRIWENPPYGIFSSKLAWLINSNPRSSLTPIVRFVVDIQRFVCDRTTPLIIEKLRSKDVAMHTYGVYAYYAWPGNQLNGPGWSRSKWT